MHILSVLYCCCFQGQAAGAPAPELGKDDELSRKLKEMLSPFTGQLGE